MYVYMNVNDFIFKSNIHIRTCSYAHSFYNGILMCMRNQSKSSATAEQGWKDLCTQQIQVTIGIPPNETHFFQFFNINSIPTKISEKISCDKQCHIKPATKIWRHAKPNRGKHGMWGSVHAWKCATAGAHTCRLSGLEAKNMFCFCWASFATC